MRVLDWEFARGAAGGEITVRVERAVPWWAPWRDRRPRLTFTKADAIVFYQSLAKALRPLLVQAQSVATDNEEFEDDMRRAIAQASQELGCEAAPDGPRVSELMGLKGYTKR